MTAPRPAECPNLVFQRLSCRRAAAALRAKGRYRLMQVKLGVEAELYREVMPVLTPTAIMSLTQK